MQQQLRVYVHQQKRVVVLVQVIIQDPAIQMAMVPAMVPAMAIIAILLQPRQYPAYARHHVQLIVHVSCRDLRIYLVMMDLAANLDLHDRKNVKNIVRGTTLADIAQMFPGDWLPLATMTTQIPTIHIGMVGIKVFLV